MERQIKRKQFPGRKKEETSEVKTEAEKVIDTRTKSELAKLIEPEPEALPTVTSTGAPKARKRDGSLDKRGRKPRRQQLTKYSKALKLLDENIEEALQVVITGLRDNDRYYRLKCAELLLKKAIPDKKQNEHTGPNGGPMRLRISREDMVEAVDALDAMVWERINQKQIQ